MTYHRGKFFGMDSGLGHGLMSPLQQAGVTIVFKKIKRKSSALHSQPEAGSNVI
jgi:hypothetical protein